MQKTKRPIGINLLALWWMTGAVVGFYAVYRAWSIHQSFSLEGFFQSGLGGLVNSSYLYLIVILIIRITASLGLLLMKPWARGLSLGLAFFPLFSVLVNGLIFGTQSIRWFSPIIAIFEAVLIVWFLYEASIRKLFNVSETDLSKEKRSWQIALVCVAFLIFLYAIYLFSFIAKHPQAVRPVQEHAYEQMKFSDIPLDYVERRFFGVSMFLPKDIKYLNLDSGSKTLDEIGYEQAIDKTRTVRVRNSDKTIFLMINKDSIFDVMAPVLRFIYKGGTPYELGKKYLNEKIGLVPLILKSIVMGDPEKSASFNISFGNWHGFLLKYQNEKNFKVYEYSLWERTTCKGIGITFLFQDKAVSEDEIEQIVVSVNLAKPALK